MEGEATNTETEDETMVLKKKRARRVSFAELTSVHIFNRDDDHDLTPPVTEDHEVDPSKPNSGVGEEENEEAVGFFKDLGDSDDSRESSPNQNDERSKPFLFRPIGSPSPGGSSTAGSATSIDEDNFFGPVSANFIRPGRLSDSAASYDDNHDVTMDSTVFSMHFRSLARSDSGQGDLKTPTMTVPSHCLLFEEKTPSHDATTTTSIDGGGSFMVLTNAKKLNFQPAVPVDNVSGGRDSNDMSIVGENPPSYDYGRLSPTLDALLEQGTKDFSRNSIKGSEDFNDMVKLGDAVDGSTTTPIDHITDADNDHQIQTPKELSKASKEITKDAIGMSRPVFQFTADNTPTPSNVDGKFIQLDVFAQHEPGSQPLNEGQVKENSLKDRRHYSDINQNSGQEYGSQLDQSISSLSSKQWQSHLNSPNSARHMGIVTPPSRPPGSFLSKESIKHGESASSIHRSISMFKIFEPSPSSSSLKEGIDNLKRRLSNYSSMPSPLNTVLAGNRKDLQSRAVHTLIARLEEQLCSADMKNGDRKRLINIDGDGLETPKSIVNLSQNEETTGLAKDKESSQHMSMGLLSMDKPTRAMAAVTSPSQFTRSGRKLMQNLLMSGNPTEGTLVTSEIDTSLVEITLDYGKDKKGTGIPDKFVSSPVKSLDCNLSPSMKFQGSVSSELKQQDQYNKTVSVGPGQGRDSVENVTGDSHSTLIADETDFLLLERRAESNSPFLNTSHVKDFAEVERVVDGNLPHLQNESETFTNFQTHYRDRDILNFQLESLEKNLQAGADLPQWKSYFRRSTNDSSLQKSPSKKDLVQNLTFKGSTQSPSREKPTRSPTKKESTQSPSRKETTQSPTSKESTQSPSRQEPSSASHNDIMMPFLRKLSPKSNSNRHDNDCHQEVQISQSPFRTQDKDNGSGRKRRNVEISYGDGDHIDKIARIQRSPKGHKSGGCGLGSMLEHSNEINNEKEKIGGDTCWNHWADILVKFSGDTEQLLSELIDKLNLKAIGVLEDILALLLNVKKYEMLSSEIQSQKIADHFSNVRHKRVAETKMLLYKIIYKKAKMQLMSVKRDRLLKRIQLLSSGIQQCQMLKLNVKHLSEAGARDAQIDHSEGIDEVSCDKRSTMRQEFEALDRKIKSLSKCFHSNCKIKGEPSCANTIALVHDHLKKRMSCRFIRQELQLWEVVDFESKNGHYNVLLNYQGYISQRFALIAFPVSSIIISNKLNDTNILQNFPNMDVCTAFAFVLHAETTKKHVGVRCLAQETQITSSLLRNLLDVVEEVQLARIEIGNLIQTSFHSPSGNVEQLDLQLCFIDFSSGRKVTLNLDMTCLNRGVYPSEIFPNEIQALTAGTQKSWPQPLIAEIRAAAENLRAGYSRIIRLCRSVSQVVQTSSS